MTKLNQVIAIEKGVKSRATSVISELYKIAQKPAVFEGLTREYQPLNDEGDKLPGERKVVQARVTDLLSAYRLAEAEFINVAAQKEKANTIASAPVLVDEKVVLPEMPVGMLLTLEKRLTDFRTFVEALPVLDISESWQYDASADVHRSQTVQTHRTIKTQKPLVLFPATDKHPAQTQLVTQDEIAGYWHSTKQSGAIQRNEKLEILRRVDKLIIGVKQAREAANAIDAGKGEDLGARIFEFLLSR
jgi:hypothetical protein